MNILFLILKYILFGKIIFKDMYFFKTHKMLQRFSKIILISTKRSNYL